MELLYLDNDAPAYYPVGAYFLTNWEYIRATADKIMSVFDDGESLILIGRGTSGAILSGALAAILREDRTVSIHISRKSKEDSHGVNLDGLNCEAFEESHIIVVDDFLETGNTILAILQDLKEKFRTEVPIDMLCVGNYLSYDSFTEGGERYWDNWRKIAENFKYIVCNNPKYR